jgi:hypothetical protein
MPRGRTFAKKYSRREELRPEGTLAGKPSVTVDISVRPSHGILHRRSAG